MPKAVLHRMDLPNYTCGSGTAARDLLRREGFEIEEHIFLVAALLLEGVVSILYAISMSSHQKSWI